jgi:leucyl/phenylalanyl-tRNA--protein transferase
MEQLNRWNYSLVDCQVASEHLLSLGAGEISRKEFVAEITELTQQQSPIGQWSFDDAMEADLKASL